MTALPPKDGVIGLPACGGDQIHGPAIFDCDVLALDQAAVLEALTKCAEQMQYVAGDALLRNPITGIACCARAASGHEATTPPSSVMNSRRFIIRSPRRRAVAER
jgi:hypothetical protein